MAESILDGLATDDTLHDIYNLIAAPPAYDPTANRMNVAATVSGSLTTVSTVTTVGTISALDTIQARILPLGMDAMAFDAMVLSHIT